VPPRPMQNVDDAPPPSPLVLVLAFPILTETACPLDCWATKTVALKHDFVGQAFSKTIKQFVAGFQGHFTGTHVDAVCPGDGFPVGPGDG
jgi:hypothetical protein